jgi:hypothetical protein
VRRRDRALALASLCLYTCTAGSSAGSRQVRSVSLCSGVSLSASYLAAVSPEVSTNVSTNQGPGFRFVLANHTDREIRLAEPVPSSSHWYARSQGRWLWRASSGAGGSLLDAGNEHGRVVVYPPGPGTGERKLLVLPPHQSREWMESEQENPVLAYKPGCKQCSYPGEREYQVVFAYAYLAGKGQSAGLLGCGLRSSPVPMPPKF